MLDYLTHIFIGVVQGLTEFLPVSSSGHTFLLKYFFEIEIGLVFEAWLHLASLLAVVWFFRKRLIDLISSFFGFLGMKIQWLTSEPFNFHPQKTTEGLFATKLIVATLFTFPIALLINNFFIKTDFLNITTVAITLFITGILILISEKVGKENKKFIWPIVIALGLFQGLAVIPGISRAGLTIALLIILGIKRKKSVEISFLLAIPTILGAFIFSIADIGVKSFLLLTPELVFAFVASFLFSILSIKYMLKWVEDKWIYFAFYCFVFSIGLLIFI